MHIHDDLLAHSCDLLSGHGEAVGNTRGARVRGSLDSVRASAETQSVQQSYDPGRYGEGSNIRASVDSVNKSYDNMNVHGLRQDAGAAAQGGYAMMHAQHNQQIRRFVVLFLVLPKKYPVHAL